MDCAAEPARASATHAPRSTSFDHAGRSFVFVLKLAIVAQPATPARLRAFGSGACRNRRLWLKGTVSPEQGCLPSQPCLAVALLLHSVAANMHVLLGEQVW